MNDADIKIKWIDRSEAFIISKETLVYDKLKELVGI